MAANTMQTRKVNCRIEDFSVSHARCHG